MAAFEYKALDAQGRQRKGVIEADSARHARSILRDQELLPTSVGATSQRKNKRSTLAGVRRSLRGLDQVLFTRQLATLVASSMPLEEALAAVAEQSEKQHAKALIMDIRSKVLEGFTLANSMSEHPSSFSDLYCATVAAGEQSGFLDRVLENLADYQERQFAATRNVEMAMFYPIALVIMSFMIVTGLMVYVVPDMVNVIVDSGQQLPWFTEILIAATAFLGQFWWLLALLVAATVLGIKWLLRQPKLRIRWDQSTFQIPLMGRIVRSANAARYANTLSILSRSGVPLVDAMHICSDVVANTWLRRELRAATQSVSEGMSLKQSLGKIGQLPPMMLHMVAAGEQSGELDEMLARVADFQQNELERVVSTLVKLFEPIMLIFMGAIVLFIVMAIMLPILSMNQLV